MDTPERSQIGGSSMSRFEESPVFNYLSNLSPIKPVKFTHISQTFTSLNFSSLPSIFTSPHVSSHKETRFLRRHNEQDKATHEFSYIDANGNKENEVFVDVNQLRNYSNELCKELDAGDSLGKSSAESNHAVQLSQSLKYDSGSPETQPKDHNMIEEHASQSVEASEAAAPFAHATSVIGPALHGTPRGWESLISDGSDLLMFDSPNFAKDLKALFRSPPIERVGSSLVSQFPPDTHVGTSFISQFPQDTSDFLRPDSAFLVDGDELRTEAHPSESEGIESVHDDHFDSLTECMTTTQPSDNVDDDDDDNDDEPMTVLHRGVRRRCLVFDTNAANRKSCLGASRSGPMGLQSVEKASKVKTRVTNKPTGNSSLRVLPGIGLHLNALGTSADGGAQVRMSNSTKSFLSPTTMQESIHDLLTGTPSDKNAESMLAQGSDNASLSLISLDELNQNSPRKKRRKPDDSGDESCKRCNCKKSKCLKLYCECFAAGVYCIGTCACKDCLNKPIHEETVLATRKQIESRNPLAFAPKVIRTTDPLPDVKDEILSTPASARHKRGCNCKKSSCLKKYCECYQGGVGCSVNCRCESCKNMFGTKDGSIPIESPNYDEETEKVQKKMSNKKSQKIMLQSNEDHNPNTLPETPLRLTRLAVQLPFSSKGKPPRSFTVGSASSGLQTNQKLAKPNYLNPPPKFQRNYSSDDQEENEIPEMLLSNGSPSSIIKTSSPNSKRISSPNSNIGSSSARKSNRKLILQSIPAFPSLNQP